MVLVYSSKDLPGSVIGRHQMKSVGSREGFRKTKDLKPVGWTANLVQFKRTSILLRAFHDAGSSRFR